MYSYSDFSHKEIKLCISNDNYFQHISGDGSILVGNYNIYAHPNWKHFYNVELKGMNRSIDVNNGYSVKGIFEDSKFRMFCDSTFDEVIFRDCVFNEIDIESCKFINCKFINCSGNIIFVYNTIFKRCIFTNTHIKVVRVGSKPMYFKSKRYYENDYFNLYLE